MAYDSPHEARVLERYRVPDPVVTGALRGPIDGLGMFVARTVAGAYEVLTFPIPLPPRYQPMLFPEYIWQPELPSDRADAARPLADSGSDGGPTATASQ
ncbi:MAG: hypothetical protein AUG95_01395 [Nitrospirae bacterium 13_1_20CM_4_62_6]|nr:MAG: hypothetical protein AUG95_01395 [Nitrospirae bacterium 13_1_20CM_4_62_6]